MPAPARSLRRVLAMGLVLASHWAAAQSQPGASAVGADRIRAVLTQHPKWTVYWSGLGAVTRSSDTSASQCLRANVRWRFSFARAVLVTPGARVQKIASCKVPPGRSPTIPKIGTIRLRDQVRPPGTGFSPSSHDDRNDLVHLARHRRLVSAP
jgi:hypothetical protein